MGAVLIALTVGALVVDQRLAPWYPFLLLLMLVLGLAGCYELLHLLRTTRRLPGWLCYSGVGGLVLVNWLPRLAPHCLPAGLLDPEPWHWIVGVFAAVVLAAFLLEMATFQEPGESVTRIATVI
jgi:hypothetical protein